MKETTQNAGFCAEGNESPGHQLLGITKNRRGSDDYSVARKLLFMRCIVYDWVK
jgi:hypothetical protein